MIGRNTTGWAGAVMSIQILTARGTRWARRTMRGARERAGLRRGWRARGRQAAGGSIPARAARTCRPESSPAPGDARGAPGAPWLLHFAQLAGVHVVDEPAHGVLLG